MSLSVYVAWICVCVYKENTYIVFESHWIKKNTTTTIVVLNLFAHLNFVVSNISPIYNLSSHKYENCTIKPGVCRKQTKN